MHGKVREQLIPLSGYHRQSGLLHIVEHIAPNSKIKIGEKYDKVLDKLGSPSQLNWLYNDIKFSDNNHPVGFGIQYIYYQKSKVCASKDKKYYYIMFDNKGNVVEIYDSYHPVANAIHDFENIAIGKKNIYVIFYDNRLQHKRAILWYNLSMTFQNKF